MTDNTTQSPVRPCRRKLNLLILLLVLLLIAAGTLAWSLLYGRYY